MGPTWAKVFVWRMESKIKESIPIPISGRVNNFNGQFRYHKIPFFVTCVSVCFSNTEFIARNICNFRRSANRAIVIWLQFYLNIENKKKRSSGEIFDFQKIKTGSRSTFSCHTHVTTLNWKQMVKNWSEANWKIFTMKKNPLGDIQAWLFIECRTFHLLIH